MHGATPSPALIRMKRGGIEAHTCLLIVRFYKLKRSRAMFYGAWSILSRLKIIQEKEDGRSDRERAVGLERSAEDFKRVEGIDYPWMSFRDVMAMP